MSKLFWALLQRPNGTPEMIGFPDLATRESFARAATARGVGVSGGREPATRAEAHQVASYALAGRRFILREWRNVAPIRTESTAGTSWKREFTPGYASAGTV